MRSVDLVNIRTPFAPAILSDVIAEGAALTRERPAIAFFVERRLTWYLGPHLGRQQMGRFQAFSQSKFKQKPTRCDRSVLAFYLLFLGKVGGQPLLTPRLYLRQTLLKVAGHCINPEPP